MGDPGGILGEARAYFVRSLAESEPLSPTMPRVAREVVEAVVLALIVFLLIQGSVRNFRVDGSSMKPTLEGGQFLLVNKLVYFQLDTGRLSRIIPFWKTNKPTAHFALHPPNRGDVIVFRFPRDPSKDFVKRVIGLPGEVIEQKDGTTFIDGVLLEEPYLKTEHKSVFPPTQIGEKEYFVMGTTAVAATTPALGDPSLKKTCWARSGWSTGPSMKPSYWTRPAPLSGACFAEYVQASLVKACWPPNPSSARLGVKSVPGTRDPSSKEINQVN